VRQFKNRKKKNANALKEFMIKSPIYKLIYIVTIMLHKRENRKFWFVSILSVAVLNRIQNPLIKKKFTKRRLGRSGREGDHFTGKIAIKMVTIPSWLPWPLLHEYCTLESSQKLMMGNTQIRSTTWKVDAKV